MSIELKINAPPAIMNGVICSCSSKNEKMQANSDSIERISDALDARIRQGVMLGAYVEGELAGFIGEHVEGSMGLLHVMPAYRRMHLGYALERAAIRRTRLAGQIPFDQVAKTNDASIALQARRGMTRAKETVYWITDDTY